MAFMRFIIDNYDTYKVYWDVLNVLEQIILFLHHISSMYIQFIILNS